MENNKIGILLVKVIHTKYIQNLDGKKDLSKLLGLEI
jgi:hypothetical protein